MSGIELDEVKVEGVHVYEKMDNRNVNEETYDNLETEEKSKTDNTSKENMDKTKVIIVVLCVVVAAVVVAVVAVGSIALGATDGGWTGWEDWGACSVTCGAGFTTRIRTCSNPRPSKMGRYCDGTAVQVQTCNNNSCPATDSGWTGWEDWAACSVMCGIDFTTRTRTCSNPRQSILGHYFDGSAVQVKTCNNNSCSSSYPSF